MTGTSALERAERWIEERDMFGMRLGTQRMHDLLAALDDPQRTAPALHVVGTNGKSSTTRLAAAVLGAGGARVGAYLSPHISHWRERIRVGERALDPGAFVGAIDAVRDAAAELRRPPGDEVTQFEALTAAAFIAFSRAGVDAMVIEAGLGGRHDATNVLAPGAAVVLTNVSRDHTALLGDSEAEIVAEKLAVCVDGHDRLAIGPGGAESALAIRSECSRRRLRPEWVGHEISVGEGPHGIDLTTPRGHYTGLRLPLHGHFQRGNLAVAIAGAEMVRGGSLEGPIREAIASVRVPGRLELLPGAPPVLLDGAHNPGGVEALVCALPTVLAGRTPRVGVVSVLDDKDLEAMMALLAPALDIVVACESHHPRARPAHELALVAARWGATATVSPDPVRALVAARRHAGPRGAVVVAGSLYLLADLHPLLGTS